MLNTTTQSKQSQQYIPHYPFDSVNNKPRCYRYQDTLSVSALISVSVTRLSVSVGLSVAENRFAKIPEKMPYRYHPMTQINSSLIGSLPIVECL